MSELNEVTANIRLQRLRRYIDEEIERWEGRVAELWGDDYCEGRIHALDRVRVLYLLTPEESADAERVRREMLA